MQPQLVGGWANPLKNMSQLGLFFLDGKIKVMFHSPPTRPGHFDVFWMAWGPLECHTMSHMSDSALVALAMVMCSKTPSIFFSATLSSSSCPSAGSDWSISRFRASTERVIPSKLPVSPRTYLVGGWATPPKNMKVNWDYHSQNMGT